MDRYCILDGYRSRPDPDYLDATKSTDESQNDVYAAARSLADLHGLKSVVDVGVGSGFKLFKYFDHLDVTGVDVEQTIAKLRVMRPDRRWVQFPDVVDGCDLLICADVVEHVADPDPFLDYLKSFRPKLLVVSTPERGILVRDYGVPASGPPRNTCHAREWTFDEFRMYLDRHFEVLEHSIVCPRQATQMAVCALRT